MNRSILCLSTIGLLAQAPSDPNAQLLIDALQRIKSNDKQVSSDFDSNGSLFKRIVGLNPNSISQSTRLNAAFWLLQRNMVVGLRGTGKQSYLQVVRNQTDMTKAWELLEQPFDAHSVREQNSLRLEISWRLLDISKMRIAYDHARLEKDLGVRELFHLVMISAHLGEWDAMKKYAEYAQTKNFSMTNFHETALNDQSFFDYESILHAVETEKPTEILEMPLVQTFRVNKWKCRIREVDGSDKKQVEPVKAQLKIQGDKWIDHAESRIPLFQVGATVHWLEDYMQPPVSGFIESNKIVLHGYRVHKESNNEILRQDDVWVMRQDPKKPGVWTGTSTMTIRPVASTPDAKPSLYLVMENEWTLSPVEKL